MQPAVLRWARERARFSLEQLASKLKVNQSVVLEWEDSGRIGLDMVDALARCTYTPAGHLYLASPPDDSLPIADYRTRGDTPPRRPSPDLLETVFQMQRRQMWMREELIDSEVPALDFVGAFDLDSPPQQVAVAMRDALRLADGWAAVEGNWTNALRTLRDRVDSAGVLVVFNGVVGNNTHRKLQPDEFQGFALVDEYAPLIFVNNADFKTAQIFTLAHELAHIFVGQGGLSRFENLHPSDHATELMCNRTAAEFLIPKEELLELWPAAVQSADRYRDLARHFKVSTVVVARRALDSELITRDDFFDYYQENKAKNWGGSQTENSPGGGNFWNNQHWRIGSRFASAVLRAVKEGRLPYREAYALTGLRGDTFDSLQEKMGIGL